MAKTKASTAFPGRRGVPCPLPTWRTTLLTYAAAFPTLAPAPPPPDGHPVSDTTTSRPAGAPALSNAAYTASTMASNMLPYDAPPSVTVTAPPAPPEVDADCSSA